MHGFLVVDKPAGISSADALMPIKRAVGRGVKVGHAGTLDPFATGVLLVLVGDATRLAGLTRDLPKEYIASVRFGRETDTLDPGGRIVAEADPGDAPPRGFAEAVGSFTGSIEQIPPAYSAVKVDGRRAYKLARSGKDVSIAPRRVLIHETEVQSIEWPDAQLRILCATGTYIRSLARDLGAEIGFPAHLTSLRRTAIGPLRADEGATLDEIAEGGVMGKWLRTPLDLAKLAGLDELDLGPESAAMFAHGRFVPVTHPPAGELGVTHEGGQRLLGLGSVDVEVGLRPVVVLHSEAVRARS